MYGISLVEHYLYSLPEYHLEFQRKNYIEVYSYNGLLATRKVIGEVINRSSRGVNVCDVVNV